MISSFEKEAISEVEGLRNKLVAYEGENLRKQRFYDGKFRVNDIGISLPPVLRNIESVVGWPGTVVDVLEERLDFEGWSEPFLDDVFLQNDLDVEAPLVHSDALIYGVSYATVTSGADGDPDVVVDMVPPTQMVGVRDYRRRVLSSAAQFINSSDDGIHTYDRAVLFRPDETVWLVNDNGWRVERVDEHRLGRVQAVQFTNRMRASKLGGRSEITPAVISYTESALRTLVGAEVAREFYAVPQRWMMGAPESFFINEDGSPRKAWDAMMGKILVAERDPDTGEAPSVGAFPAHSMSPFFEQVRHYSQLLAAETSIPPNYLGFVTDNPASADAIRMAENRLVKRAERRQSAFGKSWTELGRLALMVRDGRDFDSLSSDELNMRPLWRDAATPTKAASTDQALKLHSMGVPVGDYMMKMLGLSAVERDMLKRDMLSDSSAAISRLASGGGVFQSGQSASVDTPVDAGGLNAD